MGERRFVVWDAEGRPLGAFAAFDVANEWAHLRVLQERTPLPLPLTIGRPAAGIPAIRWTATDGEGGRGLVLVLVDALSTRWAWYPVTTPGGKVVWSEIRAESQPPPPAAHSKPGDLESPAPLPKRTPYGGQESAFLVTFRDDPELLPRIVDRLRALDTWQLPNLDGGPLPARSRHRGTHLVSHRLSHDRARPSRRHSEAFGRQDGPA